MKERKIKGEERGEREITGMNTHKKEEVRGQVATCLLGRLAGLNDSGEPDDCKVK